MMSASPQFREKLASRSVLVIGLLLGFFYSFFHYLEFRYVSHTAHAFSRAVVSGLSLGSLLALFWLALQKNFKNIRTRYYGQAGRQLAVIVRQGELPQDAALRKALPDYIASMLKLNRWLMVFMPIAFGLFTVFELSIWLGQHLLFGLIGAIVFAGFGIVSPITTRRQKQQLIKMQAKLKH